MSEQNEPTMEEILASIRRIISEEGEDKGGDAPVAAAPAPAPAPRPKPEPVPEPAPVAAPATPLNQSDIDDVFELTEVVEDDPEPAPDPEPDPDPWAEAADPAPAHDEGLVSPAAAALTANQFSALSNLLTSGYHGEGKTLEQLVQDMLRPLLKAWLDENLPALVERLVAQEIERLSRKR